MIFNDKYNEIINVATEHNNELRRLVCNAFKKLQPSIIKKIMKGEDVYRDFVTYENIYSSNSKLYCSTLVIYCNEIEYRLHLLNFDTKWLNELPRKQSIKCGNVFDNKNDIFTFDIIHYIDSSRQIFDYANCYSLKIYHVNELGYIYKLMCTVEDGSCEPLIKDSSIKIVGVNHIEELAEQDINII